MSTVEWTASASMATEPVTAAATYFAAAMRRVSEQSGDDDPGAPSANGASRPMPDASEAGPGPAIKPACLAPENR